MAITAVTTWEGTPAAMELVVAGSREAVELHESLGAKNARILRDSHEGRGVAHYAIDFDSHEAYGAFQDAVMAHEWVGPDHGGRRRGAYPDLQMKGTTVFYDALQGLNWWLRTAWQTGVGNSAAHSYASGLMAIEPGARRIIPTGAHSA